MVAPGWPARGLDGEHGLVRGALRPAPPGTHPNRAPALIASRQEGRCLWRLDFNRDELSVGQGWKAQALLIGFVVPLDKSPETFLTWEALWKLLLCPQLTAAHRALVARTGQAWRRLTPPFFGVLRGGVPGAPRDDGDLRQVAAACG